MVAKRQLPSSPGFISATIPTLRLLRAVKMADAVRNDGFRGIPILACLTLVASKDGVAVEYRGTDEWARVQAGGSGDGCIVVPSGSLLAFLGSVTADEVTIDKKADDARAVFSTPTQTFTVMCQSPDDTPEPKWGGELVRTLHLAEGVFASLLELTLPFVSTEETRYYLNGVAVAVKNNVMTAVATDGHRLAKRETTLAETGTDIATSIIPHAACKLVRSLIGPAEIEMTVRQAGVDFKAGDIEFRSKLIDGTYPDWSRVVPAVGDHAITFDGATATRCMRAIKGMSRERGRSVTIRGGEHGAEFTMSAADNHIEFATLVEGRTKGRPKTLGLNARYLAGIIKLVGGCEVTINMTEEGKDGDGACCGAPVRVTSDRMPAGDIVVVMPMRV